MVQLPASCATGSGRKWGDGLGEKGVFVVGIPVHFYSFPDIRYAMILRGFPSCESPHMLFA